MIKVAGDTGTPADNNHLDTVTIADIRLSSARWREVFPVRDNNGV